MKVIFPLTLLFKTKRYFPLVILHWIPTFQLPLRPWIHCFLNSFLNFLIEDQSLSCSSEGPFKLSEFHGPISTTDCSTTMSLNPPTPVRFLSIQLPLPPLLEISISSFTISSSLRDYIFPGKSLIHFYSWKYKSSAPLEG